MQGSTSSHCKLDKRWKILYKPNKHKKKKSVFFTPSNFFFFQKLLQLPYKVSSYTSRIVKSKSMKADNPTTPRLKNLLSCKYRKKRVEKKNHWKKHKSQPEITFLKKKEGKSFFLKIWEILRTLFFFHKRKLKKKKKKAKSRKNEPIRLSDRKMFPFSKRSLFNTAERTPKHFFREIYENIFIIKAFFNLPFFFGYLKIRFRYLHLGIFNPIRGFNERVFNLTTSKSFSFFFYKKRKKNSFCCEICFFFFLHFPGVILFLMNVCAWL